MPNDNPYAAGKNVYRGGSNVATMGPVNPMGYVDRELNNRRSQMAQSMLQNMNKSQSSPTTPSGPVYGLNPQHVSLLAVRMLNGGYNSGY